MFAVSYIISVAEATDDTHLQPIVPNLVVSKIDAAETMAFSL